MKISMTQEQKNLLIEHLAWLDKVSRDEEYEQYRAGINFCIGSFAAWMSNCESDEYKNILALIEGRTK